MNSMVRVGDGDGLYGEYWNISGDRRLSIVLRDLNPRGICRYAYYADIEEDIFST